MSGVVSLGRWGTCKGARHAVSTRGYTCVWLGWNVMSRLQAADVHYAGQHFEVKLSVQRVAVSFAM